MTSTEPMTYKPGPEIDARIAQAFGWEHFNTSLGIVAKQPDGTTLHPHFSTTWEGMRLVVEEMQRRGWELGLFTDPDGWLAEFIILENGSVSKGRADTAPHAVALAALSTLQHVSEELDKDD